MVTSITNSALVRTIEACGGTLLIDEAENLNNPKDPKGETQLALLKGANKTNNQVMISIPSDKGWVPVLIDAGTPISLGHIKPLDDVLEDRVITMPMQTTLNIIKSQKPIDDKDRVWIKLRAQFYRVLFENYAEIYRLKNEDYQSDLISNRELNQIWKPIITLAKFIESKGVNDLQTKVESVIKVSHEKKINSNLEQNLDIQVLDALIELFSREDNPIPSIKKEWYEQKNIHTQISALDGFERSFSLISLGQTLDKLGFDRKKITPYGKCVCITKGILATTAKRYGLQTPSEWSAEQTTFSK